MNWTNPGVSKSAKKEEVEIAGLISGFSARMRKRAASTKGETAPSYEAPSGKRPKLSGLDEQAQKSPTVINVDSPN